MTDKPKKSDRQWIGDEEWLFDGHTWLHLSDPWTPHMATIAEMDAMKARLKPNHLRLVVDNG